MESNKGKKSGGGIAPHKVIVDPMNHLRPIHFYHEHKMKLNPISTIMSKVEEPPIVRNVYWLIHAS